MEADEKHIRAKSFDAVAAPYAEHRPDYPTEAVQWLVGAAPVRVLELGAGTGKLTSKLCELGHDVVATDPSPQMLAQLAKSAPQARRVLATAEAIPLASGSVDVVVAAQSYHWFDQAAATPEIARVLKPGGTVAVAYNTGDRKVPWVKKVYALIGQAPDHHLVNPFDESDIFEPAEHSEFRHWQVFRRDTLVGFVASQSRVAILGPDEQEQRIIAAEELYDSYGRGPDGLLMPWMTLGYRGRVAGLVSPMAAADDEPTQQVAVSEMDDGLLIDFR